MDKDYIEWLHNNGYMPDWAYYQQNGKSAQENYAEQLNKHSELLRRKKQEEDWFLAFMARMEDALEPAAYQILDDLFKGFKGFMR